MYINVKFPINLRPFYGKKGLCFVSLLFVIVFALSVFPSIFNSNDYEVSFFVSGVSSTVVSNEVELIRAVNNAVGPVIIAFDDDIVITGSSLIIPANKDVTLTSSNRASGFYKLIGTISVHNNGVLRLDGITVTHTDDAWGCGVIVYSGGQLFMSNGEITCNYGMLGGGGGVSVYGSFILSGGSITDNTAQYGGGGVSVKYGGSFSMTGGTISGNKAFYVDACDMDVYGSGGGVDVYEGSFILSGGSITDNKASYGGGVYVTSEGSFTMTGGSITGNYAFVDSNNYGGFGGGAFFYPSTNVNRTGGAISDNTGGDVYTYGDNTNSSSDNENGSSASNDHNTGSSSNRGDGFSLVDIIVICIGIIVAVGIALVVMFSSLQKRVTK